MASALDDLFNLAAADRSRVQARPDRDASSALSALEVQAVREADFTLLGEEVVGVSSDGIVLSTSRPAKQGEAVMVSLRVPSTGNWVDAEGIIAAVANPEPGEPAQQVSIELGRMDGDSKSVVELLALLERAEAIFA
jgi:hypothetical protein